MHVMAMEAIKCNQVYKNVHVVEVQTNSELFDTEQYMIVICNTVIIHYILRVTSLVCT